MESVRDSSNNSQKQNFAIYQKGQSYSFVVSEQPQGRFSEVARLFQNFKNAFIHLGQKKLDAATTAVVLQRAASFQAGTKVSSDSPAEQEAEKYCQQKVDPVAQALLDKMKGKDIRGLAREYRQEHGEKIEATPTYAKRVLKTKQGAELRLQMEKALQSIPDLTDASGKTIRESAVANANKLLFGTAQVAKGARDGWRDMPHTTLTDQTGKLLFKGKLGENQEGFQQFLAFFAEKMLPPEKRKELEKELKTLDKSDKARDWGQAWLDAGKGSPPFNALLSALSQETYLHSIQGIFHHFSRGSQLNREEFVIVEKIPKERAYNFTLLENGNLRVEVQMQHEIAAKPKPDEIEPPKLANFNYKAVWEFNPKMECVGFDSKVDDVKYLNR